MEERVELEIARLKATCATQERFIEILTKKVFELARPIDPESLKRAEAILASFGVES